MKIFKATRRYEKRLREQLDVFEDDLAFKAKKMSEDAFSFLRGTFYRWMQLWPETCKKIAKAPVVLSVGDLQAANFGTWRNTKNQLVWGINDFDETAPLPYTQDLTRLAASVELASESEELKIGLEEACEAILNGYRESIESGGKPFILNRENDWLRKAYLQDKKSPDVFWRELDQLPDLEVEIPPNARAALELSFPARGLEFRLKHRQAGVGSLGRPRFTALATHKGKPIARDTKPLLPSAAFWAKKKHKRAGIYYEDILTRAVRSLDPIVKVHQGWVVRRLAPDCRRVELDELGPERDEKRMMYAMGWETGNIHLGTPNAIPAVLQDLKDRKKDWLVKAPGKMAKATAKEWEKWKKRD
jgi:hypothetical protein